MLLRSFCSTESGGREGGTDARDGKNQEGGAGEGGCGVERVGDGEITRCGEA